MIRLALISLISLVASTAQADTVGSYSKCKTLGANAGACNACLRGGQMFNFDNDRKKWVCGNTTGMKKSEPHPKTSVTKKSTAGKQTQKPRSVKKR